MQKEEKEQLLLIFSQTDANTWGYLTANLADGSQIKFTAKATPEEDWKKSYQLEDAVIVKKINKDDIVKLRLIEKITDKRIISNHVKNIVDIDVLNKSFEKIVIATEQISSIREKWLAEQSKEVQAPKKH